ncbi:MAG: hypothetical protein NC115_04745 [Bacteroidales bacterium]|nr:hypothetical protein [Bacteroidales bacterium]
MKSYTERLCAMALLAGLISCSSGNVTPEGPDVPPVIEDPYAIQIVNGTFEEGLDGWTVKDYYNGSKAILEIVEGQGVKDSRCLKIQQLPENGKCCIAVEQRLTGLEPDQMYRITARIRYSDIPSGEGTGPVVFSPNTKQYWNSSRYLYGTDLKQWTTVTMDFMSDDNGEATISAALGFWQGGMANGGRSTGTAYFDNISVKKISDELFTLEGEHVKIYIEPSKVTVPTTVLSKWLERLDMMYVSYTELMGAAPHEGRKLAIQTTRGIYSGYWALAGYPILWSMNYTAVEESFAQMKDYDDWCFGLMHEMGHVFNLGNSSWNWNDEMFANFRMHYGLARNNGKVYMDGTDGKRIYTGNEILDMYRIDYDKTIGTKVNDNGIHYMLARLADEGTIGWEPFCRTFKYLQQNGGNGGSGYDKFIYFVNTLSRYATEVHGRDINALNFFTAQELESIRKQLQ